MKLMLFLSHNGILSRRKAFDAIKNGTVMVNGRVNREPSTEVDGTRDKVVYNGRSVSGRIFEYVIMNKPQGYVTTCEKQFDQRMVMDLLPKELGHLRPVGRLDKDTEGLLLFTNDGELANQMAHPGFNVDKTYQARVRGFVSDEDAGRLEAGVVIDGKRTSPAEVQILSRGGEESEIQITIHEGRKHQVRLMGDAVGHTVVNLRRLRQGPLSLDNLRSGEWRRLTDEEVAAIRRLKRSPRQARPAARQQHSSALSQDKKYIGRRERGEYNRGQKMLRNSQQREKDRRESVEHQEERRGRPVRDQRERPVRDQRERPVRDQRERPVRDQRERPVQDRRARSSRDQRPAERSTPRERDYRPQPSGSDRRPPRPVYSSKSGHRSAPRAGQRPAWGNPAASSSDDRGGRSAATRSWHSESDEHHQKERRV